MLSREYRSFIVQCGEGGQNPGGNIVTLLRGGVSRGDSIFFSEGQKNFDLPRSNDSRGRESNPIFSHRRSLVG